ncbi:MAG TPA: DUF2306 domain-containing protein [Bradyrhizobium sp.]|nr:DUF2306 domain-containing protein [Bradyrhizobium sp.]
MMTNLTFIGTVHMALAVLCIMVGAIQLVRPKHGAVHRARGYAFVYGMVVVDGTAMLLYRFTGSFNAFHVGAIVNLAAIIAAMVPMLMSPRPPNWKQWHYRSMSWGFVGLMAAAVTETIVRSVALSHGQAWAVAGAAAGSVTPIGGYLIRRHQPPPTARLATAKTTIQPEGAT